MASALRARHTGNTAADNVDEDSEPEVLDDDGTPMNCAVAGASLDCKLTQSVTTLQSNKLSLPLSSHKHTSSASSIE